MRLMIVLLLAALIVAVPVMHTHPLLPALAGSSDAAGLNASSVCAICAVGAGQIVLSLPVVTVLIVTVPVIEVSIDSESADRTAPGTSRAPPTA